MIGAAKNKSVYLSGLTAMRLVLVLIVALCLPETRVWGFGITAPPASEVFDSVTRLSIGENYDGFAYDASDSLHAAKTIAPRALTQADLGISGTLKELKGTFSVTDGVATARVDMIRGDISNPFKVVENLSATARAQGATKLRIEGTLANERLYNILQKRYGLVTEGSNDIITIPLK
jgi:hypothetical protein